MCFYAAHFAYLLTSAYFYYERSSSGTNLQLDHVVEIQWIVFNSLGHLTLIATSVAIRKEVLLYPL